MDASPPDPASQRAGIGLRVSLYLLTCLFVLQIGSVLLLPILDPEAFERVRENGDLESLGLGVLLAIQAILAPVVLAVTLAFVRVFDRDAGPLALGVGPLRAPGRSLGLAIALPVAVLTAWTLATFVLADLSLGSSDPLVPGQDALEGSDATVGLGTVLLYGIGFLAASVAQEWMLRGYVYSTIRTRLAWVHAAGATAVLQIVLQWSPEADVAALVNVFLIALGLGAARELTGSVWPGALFHGVWNLFLGCVLSLPISGLEAPHLLDVSLQGAVAWTGGSWGPEGSWSMTSLLLVLVFALAMPLAERDEAEREARD